ncbi:MULTISPECIES: Lrp/AsnC family transcriptional regulator [Kitasatospora]|uniref:Putative AsnC family transcriptional regulator n=1 Tax=Kitasatospora setae (strain ATCC 33774 / DSM 43861 / JCM 3304 / KCC A-0304 / NBRC 14216 / KM-6054) TaxID=452652 RepID=E4NAN2_KITSK|nr:MULTISPECIES: Lrp/AsnC family transcriptional regulator [Kitasatospora]BAJ28263.1 putative AsnC family transcriptional regulator [Kitasatospora setae KM-6054]
MDTETADPAGLLDGLDRRLVHALQVDGRAEPGRIAEVLGVSARTVSRRLGRLFGTGAVRVVRMPDARAAALGALLLRLRVPPGRADPIALALAALDGVPFVDVMLGGQEVSAVVLADAPARDRLLYGRLPATGAVLESAAHAVLHLFADASAWRCGALTPAEEAALAPQPPSDPPGHPTGHPAGRPPLDALDHRLLDALGRDARRSHAALAGALAVPESTVRRRLRRLGAAGLLRTHVSVDPRLLGVGVDANLWLDVEPGRLAATGAALAGHPQVHGVLAVSGPGNLTAAVFCPDHAALYRFQTEVLGPLGVRRAETAIVARAVKRAGIGLRRFDGR